MSDLKVQGVVEMSSEGAERAFARIGEKADQMARQVGQAAQGAGKSTDEIGAGATRNAEEFTRAEGRMVASIKRATTELQNFGKTASQRIELRIDTQGLDRAKFEPMIAKLRELEAAQTRVAASGRNFGGAVQNTSYQLQDLIVQVNGGVDATRALGMQLPQLLGGFGAAGAAIGVVAALLPNMISLFGDAGAKALSVEDAMSALDGAIGEVGRTVRDFDMEGLFEQFNQSSAAVRAATIEQLRFQQAFIETQRLVAAKSFGESVSGLGQYGTLDKLAGAFGKSGAEKLAADLGVTLEVARELQPVLKGLRDGTEDVGLAFTEFGTKLLKGNASAVDLAKSMQTLANGERDAYAASSALSDALERMAKGHVTTKKEADEARKASEKAAKEGARAAKQAADEAERLATAGKQLVASLIGQSAGMSADFFKKWDLLGKAYKAGAISLQDLTNAQGALLKQQPAVKQAADTEEEYAKAVGSALKPLQDRAAALEIELRNYGQTKAQIERTTLARYEEVRAIAAANGASEKYLRVLDLEIEARRRIASATAELEAKEANKKAAETAAEDWKRTAQSIESAIYDALISGGEDAGEVLKRTFKAMVLEPMIRPIAQAGSQMVMGLLGMGGQGAGASGAGSLFSLFSGGGGGGHDPMAQLMGWGTGQALGPAAGMAGLVSGLSSIFAGTGVGAFGAGMARGISAFGSLSQMGATIKGGMAAGGAAGAGMIAGTVLPIVAALGGIASALGAFKGPTYHSGAAVGYGTDNRARTLGHKDQFGDTRVWGGFSETDAKGGGVFAKPLADLSKGVTDTIEGVFKQFGQGGQVSAFAAFGADGDDKSRGSMRVYDAAGNLLAANSDQALRGKKYSKDAEKGFAEFTADSAQVIRDSLVAADLPAWVDSVLMSLGDGVGMDQLNAALSGIEMIQGKTLTANDLWQKATQGLADEFGKLGYSMPNSISAFNELIKSSDELGAELFALAPAFYQLASIVDATFASISATTAASVRDIEMAMLDQAGKYAYLDTEIVGLIDKLAGSFDPGEIQGLFEQINQKAMQAYNLLDAEEQKRLGTAFIDRLYEAEALAQERLSVAPLDYEPTIVAADSQQTAAEKTAAAAESLSTAAEALSEAIARFSLNGDQSAIELRGAAGALSSAASHLGGAASSLGGAARSFSAEVGVS